MNQGVGDPAGKEHFLLMFKNMSFLVRGFLRHLLRFYMRCNAERNFPENL